MPRTRFLRRATLGGALGSLLLAGPGPAPADTLRCDRINSVPVVISSPGVYCVDRPLTTALTAGAAITIAADHVLLDLGGHTLDGSAGGPASQATGIHGVDRRGVTVRDGTVRGFRSGIRLEATSGAAPGGHVVERVRAETNISLGIGVGGAGSVARQNLVKGTGTGNTDHGGTGIGASGAGVRVLDNDVVDTLSPDASLPSQGINVAGATGAVVEGNRIAAASDGITVDESEHVLIAGNRITGTNRGIALISPPGPVSAKCRGNLFANVTFFMTGGCTDVGNNL